MDKVNPVVHVLQRHSDGHRPNTWTLLQTLKKHVSSSLRVRKSQAFSTVSTDIVILLSRDCSLLPLTPRIFRLSSIFFPQQLFGIFKAGAC